MKFAKGKEEKKDNAKILLLKYNGYKQNTGKQKETVMARYLGEEEGGK